MDSKVKKRASTLKYTLGAGTKSPAQYNLQYSMYYITDLSSKYSTEAGEILKSVVKIKEIENNRASSHLIFAVYYLKWLYTVSIGVLNEDWA